MTTPQLRDLLTNLQRKSASPAVQTSTHSPPPTTPDASLPPGTTHVFTKQHKTLGLDPSWAGPFPVMEQVSRSQVRIKIGLSKEGNVRSEVRRLHDVKPAFVDSSTQDAERPRRGRKSKQPLPSTNQSSGPDNKVNKMADRIVEPPNSNVLNGNPTKSQPSNSTVPDTVNNLQSSVEEPSNSPYGPIITQAMHESWIADMLTKRNPPRTTRNPKPSYVDALMGRSSHQG